jgi:phospholipase/carboxylesterase
MAKFLVVFLHGYGSNGANLEPLTPVLESVVTDKGHEVVFYAPNAPFKYEYEEADAYQWFSLVDRGEEVLWGGAEVARLKLEEMVKNERLKHNIQHQNVIGLGFSQGTMIGLHTFLQSTHPICGFIGFSGTLVAPKIIKSKIVSRPKVCLIHGESDPIVAFSLGKIAFNYLKDAGVETEFHKIARLEHSIDMRGLAFAKSFIGGILDNLL